MFKARLVPSWAEYLLKQLPDYNTPATALQAVNSWNLLRPPPDINMPPEGAYSASPRWALRSASRSVLRRRLLLARFDSSCGPPFRKCAFPAKRDLPGILRRTVLDHLKLLKDVGCKLVRLRLLIPAVSALEMVEVVRKLVQEDGQYQILGGVEFHSPELLVY